MEILRCKVGKLCNVDDDDFEVLFKTFSLRERERERKDYYNFRYPSLGRNENRNPGKTL